MKCNMHLCIRAAQMAVKFQSDQIIFNVNLVVPTHREILWFVKYMDDRYQTVSIKLYSFTQIEL